MAMTIEAMNRPSVLYVVVLHSAAEFVGVAIVKINHHITAAIQN